MLSSPRRSDQHIRRCRSGLCRADRRRRFVSIGRSFVFFFAVTRRIGLELGWHDTREGDRMGTVRDGLGAVFVLYEVVSRDVRSFRKLDHILGLQCADDGVIAAVGPEHDTMSRSQSRNINRVITHIAINRDGVEAQAGPGEVADDLDAVAA